MSAVAGFFHLLPSYPNLSCNENVPYLLLFALPDPPSPSSVTYRKRRLRYHMASLSGTISRLFSHPKSRMLGRESKLLLPTTDFIREAETRVMV